MPLGTKLWEESSRATHVRYVDASKKGLRAEVSFAGEVKGYGRLEGVSGRIVGTDDFWEKLSEEGILNGSARGALQLSDGEILPYRAVGMAKVVRRSPGLPVRILSLIQVINPPEKLSWMRNTLIVWEADVDPKNQSITATAYEWE
jgi:hypothetical protein